MHLLMKSTLIVFTLCSSTAIADTCPPTPHRTTGTHYKPVENYKVDISKGLKVSGRILSSTDCKPIKGVRVAHWQAGENGKYQDRLRAYLFSDDNGSYRFETEWPAAMVPHIHFIVSTDGYKTLETQWVGDERLNTINFDMVLERE